MVCISIQLNEIAEKCIMAVLQYMLPNQTLALKMESFISPIRSRMLIFNISCLITSIANLGFHY